MNNPRIGSLVRFSQYCYYGILANKLGLIVSGGACSMDPPCSRCLSGDTLYKVLVEEVIYDVFAEEFELI